MRSTGTGPTGAERGNARICNARRSGFFLCLLRGLLFMFHLIDDWPEAARKEQEETEATEKRPLAAAFA